MVIKYSYDCLHHASQVVSRKEDDRKPCQQVVKSRKPFQCMPLKRDYTLLESKTVKIFELRFEVVFDTLPLVLLIVF